MTTPKKSKQTLVVHRNKPQIKAETVDANIEVDLWGRRTGKTRGRGAAWLKKRLKQMPRCNGFILGPTYAQLISKILPEIIAGWEELGWKQNVHYWIRKYPPEEFGLPLPLRMPLDPSKAIFIYNGSVLKFYSMDRNALSLGDANDFGYYEESRKLDGQRVQEDVEPTISGTNPKWKGKYYYCSRLYVTDKPRDAKGRWILDKRKQVNPDRVSKIIGVELEKAKLKKELLKIIAKKKSDKQGKREKELVDTIKAYDNFLNILRKDLTYVSEASTLDNIDVLGYDTIKAMKRTLSPRNYKISVLNKDGIEVPNNFYADLDEDRHGYYAVNYKYIDKQEGLPKYNYHWFTDIKKNHGFDITIDTNFAGNCVSVRQFVGKEFKIVYQSFNLAPFDHKDLMRDLAEYFEPHPTKEIRFIYNSTFTNGKKHKRPYIAKECMDVLKSMGWKVKDCPIGAAWSHERLFYLWKKLLVGELPYRLTFNRLTCQQWYDSAKQAETLQSERNGLKKNKRPEQDPNVPYEEATHLTEAPDQFLQYDAMQGKRTGKTFALLK